MLRRLKNEKESNDDIIRINDRNSSFNRMRKQKEETKAADTTAKTTEASEAADTSSTGGASGDITIVSREDGSGTRGAFIELLGIEEKDANGNKVDNTTEDAKSQTVLPL